MLYLVICNTAMVCWCNKPYNDNINAVLTSSKILSI